MQAGPWASSPTGLRFRTVADKSGTPPHRSVRKLPAKPSAAANGRVFLGNRHAPAAASPGRPRKIPHDKAFSPGFFRSDNTPCRSGFDPPDAALHARALWIVVPAGTCSQGASIFPLARASFELQVRDFPSGRAARNREQNRNSRVQKSYGLEGPPQRRESAEIAGAPPLRFLRARRNRIHSARTPRASAKKILLHSLRPMHLRDPARASVW